jgi:hypothetical protein
MLIKSGNPLFVNTIHLDRLNAKIIPKIVKDFAKAYPCSWHAV